MSLSELTDSNPDLHEDGELYNHNGSHNSDLIVPVTNNAVENGHSCHGDVSERSTGVTQHHSRSQDMAQAEEEVKQVCL
jgi:hypothetical protein